MTTAPPTALAPLLLPSELRLTPEQFALVCAANPEAVLELAADGRVIPMTPTGGETGSRNTLLCTRLQIWALEQGNGRCSTAPPASASPMVRCSAPMLPW